MRTLTLPHRLDNTSGQDHQAALRDSVEARVNLPDRGFLDVLIYPNFVFTIHRALDACLAGWAVLQRRAITAAELYVALGIRSEPSYPQRRDAGRAEGICDEGPIIGILPWSDFKGPCSLALHA